MPAATSFVTESHNSIVQQNCEPQLQCTDKSNVTSATTTLASDVVVELQNSSPLEVAGKLPCNGDPTKISTDTDSVSLTINDLINQGGFGKFQ